MTTPSSSPAKLRHWCICAISSLALVSCATSTPLSLSAADAAQGLEAYRLGAGDKLRITIYNEPTLSGEYTVSSSGEIAFPLIGMVHAEGQNIPAFTAALSNTLSDGYMKDPRVSVEVLNYRPYYILGEVQRPGQYPYVAGMTLEQAVAAAGGFNYRANSRRIHLRRNPDPQEKSVDLYSGNAVHVMPGDTIRIIERYF